MASSVDMCAGVCAARCESSARGSIVGGRRAAATAARGTDGRRSPTLHLALGLLGPLFHGLDLLLVRDDLVVVFRMTLAKLLELRFPLGIETSNSPSAAWRATGIVNGDRLIDY